MLRKEWKWNLGVLFLGYNGEHKQRLSSSPLCFQQQQLTNNYPGSSIHFNDMWMHTFICCITHNLGVFPHTLCYRIIYHWGEASALCLLKIFMVFYLGKQEELHSSPSCNWQQMVILCRNAYMFVLWGTYILWVLYRNRIVTHMR